MLVSLDDEKDLSMFVDRMSDKTFGLCATI